MLITWPLHSVSWHPVVKTVCFVFNLYSCLFVSLIIYNNVSTAGSVYKWIRNCRTWMNDMSDWMWEGAVIAYFMVPYQELLNRLSKNTENINHDSYPQLTFEPGKSHMQDETLHFWANLLGKIILPESCHITNYHIISNSFITHFCAFLPIMYIKQKKITFYT